MPVHTDLYPHLRYFGYLFISIKQEVQLSQWECHFFAVIWLKPQYCTNLNADLMMSLSKKKVHCLTYYNSFGGGQEHWYQIAGNHLRVMYFYLSQKCQPVKALQDKSLEFSQGNKLLEPRTSVQN